MLDFFSYNVVISNALSFMIEWNLARVIFLLVDNVVVGNNLVFLLKVNIEHAIICSPYNVFYVLVLVQCQNSTCNIFIDNVFVFELEGNLACTRFVLQCHVVVGNLVVCAKRKYARFFDLAMMLLEICMWLC